MLPDPCDAKKSTDLPWSSLQKALEMRAADRESCYPKKRGAETGMHPGVSLPLTTSHSTDNTGVSTAETEPAGIDPQVLADLDAVMKRISDGAAVDPETSRRIEERGDRITAEIRRQPRRHGRRSVPGVAS